MLLRFEIKFSELKMKEFQYDKEDIHFTVKKAFAQYDLPNTEEDGLLIIEDEGRKDDFSYMWIVVTSLMKSKWFCECVSHCYFYDDDGTYEDVLAQVWNQ